MLPISMADYLGLTNLRFVDGDRCRRLVARLPHRPRRGGDRRGQVQGRAGDAGQPAAQRGRGRGRSSQSPEGSFELVYGSSTLGMYALAAQRHMYEFGTTSEQLAWVKVAASEHAQYNPHALLKKPVTVDGRARLADAERSAAPPGQLRGDRRRRRGDRRQPGGRAPDLAAEGQDHGPRRGAEAHQQRPHRPDVYRRALVWSARLRRGRVARPSDIDYASIYDSFTITVVETIEDLGFCEKGKGGAFVADGGLRARGGRCRSTPTVAACATTTRAWAA